MLAIEITNKLEPGTPLAAAAVVYILYIMSGFMGPTTGGDFLSIASFPTKDACETARTALAADVKQSSSRDKLPVCISTTDLDAFAEKVATPYIK